MSEDLSLSYARVIRNHAETIATMSHRNTNERGYAGWRTLLCAVCVIASTLCIIADRVILLEVRSREVSR